MPNSYRSHKRYLILNMVNYLGPVSRTRLTALTDYRPASVGAITKELLEERLLVESGHLSTGHGRKRTLLTINKEHLCAIGVGFTTATITYIVAQFDGNILERAETKVPQDAAKDLLAQDVLEEIRTLAERYADKEIVGIGLCDPPYDPTTYHEDSLQASYTHFNDWIHFQLKPRLEAATGLTVQTFSAVTLPALVEQRFGAARGVDDFFCVELSNGIGSSICCNGRVVEGSIGVAGELGHTVVDAGSSDTQLCYCGKAGCVERSTAYPALAADIRAALDRGVSSVLNSYYDRREKLTIADIRRALDEGDQLCRHYVKRSAVRIGIAIANAVNLLNPKLVVLYGFMLGLGEHFLKPLEESLRENVLTLSRHFELLTSASLESNLPLGAAAELFSQYLRIDDHKWVYQLPASELSDELDDAAEEEGREAP